MARILKRVDANNPTWDLYKVLFRYKDIRQPSRTAKMFVESGGLTHFAEKNPQVQVIVKEGGAHPTMTGFYVTGYRRRFQLDELSSREIHEKLDYLRNSAGYKPGEHYRLTKRVLKSKQLSVQGMWKGSPELWKDPVRSTESHKADERKMRALFRKINFELGASGTLKVLRKIRATQTEQLNKMQQAQKIKMVRMNSQSMEAYYSKGYVSEFLERERQNRIRVRSKVGAPARALAGASLADGKGSLDDGPGEEDGDDKEEEEEEEWEDAGYDAGDLDDDEDDDLEDDEAEEEDDDESDDASTTSSEDEDEDEDDDEFEADVDEVLGEDEYISDEELAKINLDDIWAEELGDDDDWDDEEEGPDPDVPDKGET